MTPDSGSAAGVELTPGLGAIPPEVDDGAALVLPLSGVVVSSGSSVGSGAMLGPDSLLSISRLGDINSLSFLS